MIYFTVDGKIENSVKFLPFLYQIKVPIENHRVEMRAQSINQPIKQFEALLFNISTRYYSPY